MIRFLQFQRLFFTGFLFFWQVLSFAQVCGGSNPAAAGYTAATPGRSESGTYPSNHYTPPIKVDPISNALQETSGLQVAGNSLWSFNDGGSDPVLFRIDTLTDAVLQTVVLGGAINVDWEDIAFDGTYFYIGDFGNNASGNRTDLKIYRLKLSDIPADYVANPSVTVPAAQIEVINFTYSDQMPVVATGPNHTKFDCEAMIVDGDKIHLFTKNWVDKTTTTHYVINGVTSGTYKALPMETLTTNFLVTAADKAAGKNIVALLGYQVTGTARHYLYLLSGFCNGYFFNGNKRLIELPSAAEMGQAEGLAFRTANYGYISNEKFVYTWFGATLTVNPRLYSFCIDRF